MQTLVDLGDEFRALRKAAGLTQEEVAYRLHMKQEALSRFERGRGSDFSAAKLLRLAQALGQELQFVQARKRPTLDDVLEERKQAANSGPASR